MTETKIRWRMTLDELCYRCRCTPNDLNRWAELGAFGPRLKEPRDRGWHRHITREIAQRAVIMKRLIEAGLNEQVAAQAAETHTKGDESLLIVMNDRGLRIVLERWTLNLP